MIRNACFADLPRILEIYNDAIVNTTSIYHYKPHTLDDRIFWYEKKIEEGFPVRVYEEDNQAAGFATYGHFRNFPAYKYTIEHSIYVHKDYRRKHIGTQLLQDLIEIANEKGYASMIGVIDDANESSKLMHTKFGFSDAGTLHKVGYKFGKWLNITFYEYELKGPDKPMEG